MPNTRRPTTPEQRQEMRRCRADGMSVRAIAEKFGVSATTVREYARVPKSHVQLSDDEILSQYGPVLWEALQAFSSDPEYFIAMVRQADFCDYKRMSWKARVEAEERGTPPDELSREATRILEDEWGYSLPVPIQ